MILFKVLKNFAVTPVHPLLGDIRDLSIRAGEIRTIGEEELGDEVFARGGVCPWLGWFASAP